VADSTSVIVETEVLQIEVQVDGPRNGRPVLLLHGWPDAPRGWRMIAPALQDAGYLTIIPALRGTGGTRFLSPETPRDGQASALAQDAVDLMDALGVESAAVLGHDWGARAAYTIAALYPHRISAIAALALAYQPRGVFAVPTFSQARAFWYQWFLCLDQGAAAVSREPIAFARLQWETWSPPGWYDGAEFAATAESFLNPDWVAITLNAYRSRYLPGEARDARYDELARRLSEIEIISVPTLMIQGGADYCDQPASSDGLDRYFSRGYRRDVIEGIGHFPHREAPGLVAESVVTHFRANC
jgi:pimeloyl-ACP methyl ester carboxylesterase